MLYAGKGDDEAVKLILHYGADVNVRAEAGRTALMSAIKCGNCSTVRLLLANRADPTLRDNQGKTAKDLGPCVAELAGPKLP